MEVVVEDKQLSLAIGRRPERAPRRQDRGLAIDIKSEEEKRREVEAEMARMARAVDEIRSSSGTASARRRSRSSSRPGSTASPTSSRCPTTSSLPSRRGAEDGREDPRGGDAGAPGVGGARRRRGGGEGGGGAGAGRAGAGRAGASRAGASRAGASRAGGADAAAAAQPATTEAEAPRRPRQQRGRPDPQEDATDGER